MENYSSTTLTPIKAALLFGVLPSRIEKWLTEGTLIDLDAKRCRTIEKLTRSGTIKGDWPVCTRKLSGGDAKK
jgi:DNA-binding transcriptional regulator YdaS (Cro superfamily)